MNNTRVLVTGATGFIGKPLTKALLNAGCEVLAITRKAPVEQTQIKWLEADLSQSESYQQAVNEFAPEVVIHLSWQGIPDYSFATSLDNLNQSLGLLSFVVGLQSCKKVMVSGSCWEYAGATGECLETDISVPQNDFTWAKHAIRSWLETHCEKNDVDYAWLRIFYVYGPGQRSGSLLPTILTSLRNDTLPGINTPFNANDYVYIDDVVEAFVLCVKQSFKSGIYNLGSGESIQVLEVCRLAESHVKDSNHLSQALAENAPVKVGTVDFWAGLCEVKANLGWAPKTSLVDGISQTWNYVKAL